MTSCANNHENTSDTSETVPESQIESIPSRKDEIGLKSNTYYSIMNCDTGRTIKVNGEDEFLLNQNEDGFYSLTDKNGKYLHFASNSAELSENEKFFNITLDNSYNRYQIITDGAADITKEEGAKRGIVVVPFYVYSTQDVNRKFADVDELYEEMLKIQSP